MGCSKRIAEALVWSFSHLSRHCLNAAVVRFGNVVNSSGSVIPLFKQQILTGGSPAEYAGGSGLVAKVITKSGSNEYHGSINYYLQNSNLVAKNKHLAGNEFSTYDAAITLGGPIIKDRIWFFGSFQKKNH